MLGNRISHSTHRVSCARHPSAHLALRILSDLATDLAVDLGLRRRNSREARLRLPAGSKSECSKRGTDGRRIGWSCGCALTSECPIRCNDCRADVSDRRSSRRLGQCTHNGLKGTNGRRGGERCTSQVSRRRWVVPGGPDMIFLIPYSVQRDQAHGAEVHRLVCMSSRVRVLLECSDVLAYELALIAAHQFRSDFRHGARLTPVWYIGVL